MVAVLYKTRKFKQINLIKSILIQKPVYTKIKGIRKTIVLTIIYKQLFFIVRENSWLNFFVNLSFDFKNKVFIKKMPMFIEN